MTNFVHGDLLGLLRENARKGTLLSSGEGEAQEVMRQLELHISARCKGWQEQVSQLTQQLQRSQLQVAHLQKQLLTKSSKLEEVERACQQRELEYQSKMADCESQLQQLRTSLDQINSRYSQLRHKRYSSKGGVKHHTDKRGVADKEHSGQISYKWGSSNGNNKTVPPANHALITVTKATEGRAVHTSAATTRARERTYKSQLPHESQSLTTASLGQVTIPTSATPTAVNKTAPSPSTVISSGTVSSGDLVDKLVEDHIQQLHHDLVEALQLDEGEERT